MIRKFKTVGALVAVVAMLAMTASAAQAQFTSAGYPATVTGSSSKDVIDMFGSTVTCTQDTFSGSLTAASTTLTITPVTKNCTAFGLPMTVDFTSCDFLLHKQKGIAGTFDIACSNAGDAVDINIYASSPHGTPICHVKIPAQSGKSGYTVSNTAGGTITLSGTIGALTATQTRTSIFCPAGTHTATASYTIQAGGITLTGSNGAISVH